MVLLFAVTANATAQTGNTLRYEIEHYAGGIGCVYVTGWIYDSNPGTKWWEAGVGKNIEIYGVATPTQADGDPDPLTEDAEYFVREDINSTYGLEGYHGFRITFRLKDKYLGWFPNNEEEGESKTLQVEVYAAVKDGSAPASELDEYGRYHILLGDGPIDVNVKSPFWQEPPVTQLINGQYIGFTSLPDPRTGANPWGNLVDGDLNTTISHEHSFYIDFMSDKVIIPTYMYVYSVYPQLNPASWTLYAKLHERDGWTELKSRDWPFDDHMFDYGNFPFNISNDEKRGYRYFRFAAEPQNTLKPLLSLKEITFVGSDHYEHLLPRLATCSQIGIMRECYQRYSDGKYFADDAATNEYDASLVEIPIKAHDGESYNNTGCWRCSMCGNYFSDEHCTTPQPTWSVTLPEQMEFINDAVYDADSNGKYVHGAVIDFKAKELYEGYISNVKVGETELTPDQDGIYTLTVGNADVVITANVGLLELANDADNADAICAFSNQRVLVTLKDRTLFKDGHWNTLCLPFNMTAQQVTEQLAPLSLKTLESASFQDGTLTLNFTDATEIQAGKPYIIRWTRAGNYADLDPDTRDLKNLMFTGITIPDYSTTSIAQVYSNARCQNEYVDFIGTYAPLTFSSEDRSILILQVFLNTVLTFPAENAVIGSGRGYFQLKGIHAGKMHYIKEFVLNTGEDDADGISLTPALSEGEGEWYDLSGRKFASKPTQKGIYIVNGKKILK